MTITRRDRNAPNRSRDLSTRATLAPRPIRLAMPVGAHPRVSLKVRYDGPLRAPIVEGERVAELAIFFDGRQVSTLPLVAKRSVASATQLQRVFNGIAGWLPWNW